MGLPSAGLYLSNRMKELDLARRLHRLRRTVIMLQTELRLEHLDAELLAEIEQQMDHGISTDPRSAHLSLLVDALRESILTPRPELFRDATRASEQLKEGVEVILDNL